MVVVETTQRRAVRRELIELKRPAADRRLVERRVADLSAIQPPQDMLRQDADDACAREERCEWLRQCHSNDTISKRLHVRAPKEINELWVAFEVGVWIILTVNTTSCDVIGLPSCQTSPLRN